MNIFFMDFKQGTSHDGWDYGTVNISEYGNAKIKFLGRDMRILDKLPLNIEEEVYIAFDNFYTAQSIMLSDALFFIHDGIIDFDIMIGDKLYTEFSGQFKIKQDMTIDKHDYKVEADGPISESDFPFDNVYSALSKALNEMVDLYDVDSVFQLDVHIFPEANNDLIDYFLSNYIDFQ